MTNATPYKHIAKVALSQYGITQGQLRFLGHSDNVTFWVRRDQDSFLLRIHQPIYGEPDQVWQSPDVIASEFLWLVALRRDTPIVVQQPLSNHAGQWVTQVLNKSTGQVFACSLLRWIDGHTSDAERSPRQARQLGALMAQLHQHTSQWTAPPHFIRPIYDENRLHVALQTLHDTIPQGLISGEHYQALAAAGLQSQQTMKALEPTPETWGLIHADLHERNYLFYHNQIRPIDFARCCFGYYLYDIANSLQHLLPPVRSDFFDGYQAIRPIVHSRAETIEIVEGFFIQALIEGFSFHVKNPNEHQWITQIVPHVAENHVHRYLNDAPFLFTK
jgi:Ser/Thr protein kinase RdoA (MazF antagonist)